MATKAIFIGVNKNRDPAIPELSGASRDATALWALFTDSVAGLSPSFSTHRCFPGNRAIVCLQVFDS